MDTLFSTLVPNFFLSVGNSTLTKQTNTTILGKIKYPKEKQVQNFNKNICFDETFLKLTYNLQKTVNTLNLIDYIYQPRYTNYSNNVLVNEVLTKNTTELTTKFFLLTTNNYNILAITRDSIANSESTYKLSNKSIKSFNGIINSNIKLSSFLKYDFKLQKITIANLSKNLNLAKENRWLWKNSILSDKIINDVNKTVHFKKLISNPELNENIISNSIWGSNRIKDNLNALKLDKINFKKSLTLFTNSFSSPLNLNLYEDSLIWTTKRFSFTQKMNYNSQLIVSNDKVSILKTNMIKTSLNNLFFNKFYYNYSYTNLYLSFYKVILSPIFITDQKKSTNYLTLINVNNKELLSNNDSFFIKLLLSNISLNKNEIVFYSII